MRDTEIGTIVWNYFIEKYAGESEYMYIPIPPYGKIMKHSRKVKKLTQQQVAKKLGISQNTYSKVENELVDFDERLYDIAKVLDFDIEAIEGLSKEFYKEYNFSNRIEVYSLKERCNDMINHIEYLEKTLEAKQETIQLLKEKIVMLENKK